MKYLRDYVEEIIHTEHEVSNENWSGRTATPHLHPSSIGGCPRAAILTTVKAFPAHKLHQETTHPFDLYTRSVMWSGNMWEAVLSTKLEEAFLGAYLPNQRFSNDVWSWELDALIEPGTTPEYPDGLIVELKDTAEYNFRIKDRLPYEHHCIQVLAYQELVERETKDTIPARIYYNGRGRWAEFEIQNNTENIRYEGMCDDNPRDGYFEFDVLARMQELETYWQMQELPPAYDTPFELDFGCVRGSDKKGWFPNCQWFGQCWKQMPQEGPFPNSVWEET